MISHSQPWINKSDIRSVQETAASGMIASGEKTEQFEKAVAEYYGLKYAFSTNSGRAGLLLILKALGVKKDDEIILPTYLCSSVADAVIQAGAVPVLCDIGRYWCMTAENVEPLINRRTRAIILVHMFGIAVNADDFKQFGVPIIEDCAQAFGAEYKEKLTGRAGMASFFSFHATKCLTTGEGGMVVTGNEELASNIQKVIKKNCLFRPISDIQAALGISQLKRYHRFLERRHQIAEIYFKNIQEQFTYKLQTVAEHSIFFRFPIQSKTDFYILRECMEKKGIAVRQGVDSLIHRYLGLRDIGFKNAVETFNTTVSIPILPQLTKRQVERIILNANLYIKK